MPDRSPKPIDAAFDFGRRFLVAPGASPKLAEIDPGYCARPLNKAKAQGLIERNRSRLAELQMRLYAERRQALLIYLQGPDTAGKDGVVTHILGAMNPLSCTVTGFKQPSQEELSHDFLWRYHNKAPALGWVGIFNRTPYESVLVERVHALVPNEVWWRRYAQINDFERMLTESRTKLVKFFLYISKDEQLARFEARLDDPAKQWKISESDYAERELWDHYTVAYEDAFAKCGTADALARHPSQSQMVPQPRRLANHDRRLPGHEDHGPEAERRSR